MTIKPERPTNQRRKLVIDAMQGDYDAFVKPLLGMTLNEYQQRSRFTAAGVPDNERLATSALGLAGEAGEVCDIIKKWRGHGHEIDRDKLRGDNG